MAESHWRLTRGDGEAGMLMFVVDFAGAAETAQPL